MRKRTELYRKNRWATPAINICLATYIRAKELVSLKTRCYYN